MDDKAKRDRVEAINDEVGELHPLLHGILKKLTNISYVEYTHGPNEKGADFVLEKVDPHIDSSHCVGVVAKADKILQNFSDVERQIDECSHQRLIRQGKERVRLPEVWVVTSKSISQNAKEKINEKFESRTIHFFDSDWLVKRIDEHAPYFWDEVGSAIGTYLASADKKMAVLNGQTLITMSVLGSVSIELDVQEVEADRYVRHGKSSKPRLVNVTEEVQANKITWLEAEMGYGKSFLARRIVSHFAESSSYKSRKIVPIFASFKKFLDERKPVGDFIRFAVGEEAFAAAEVDKATFLLVLDGVDEACADLDRCKSTLDSLIAEVKGRSDIKLLLTARPMKPFENDATLSSSAKRYRIRPLSMGKIIQYLRRVVEERRLPNRLLEDLGKSDLFRQLPQNPIAAALLGNLISQERYELPSNLTELYAKTMELMMGRWDEKRNISTEKLYRATERLARLLARHMIDNQLIYMSRQEVEQMFAGFLADRNVGVPVEEVCDYLFNRSSLFGSFPDTDAIFFKHRSFAEYLYGRDAYETRNFAIDSRAFHPYWLNVYFFYVGSLGECPEIIRQLIGISPSDEVARMLRFLNMGNFLLAGYQSPYPVIQDSLDVLLVEAARAYIDVRDGRILKHMGSLSEMQLLWIFSRMTRYCYGYKFFEKGLPYAMAKIDESLLDSEEVKTYSLFLAGSALKELDNDCGFQFLLEKKKARELPLPINLALRAELEHATKEFGNSSVVKQFERSLKKLLYAAGKTAQLARDAKIDALFTEPVNTRRPPVATTKTALVGK